MTNAGLVREYLVKHYGVEHGVARKAVEDHIDIVEEAQRMGSYTYFPAEKIADLEGFEEQDSDDEDDEDEDEFD